jgi:hypothetical protein
MVGERVKVPFIFSIIFPEKNHLNLIGTKSFHSIFFVYLGQVVLEINDDRAINSILVDSDQKSWIPVFYVQRVFLGNQNLRKQKNKKQRVEKKLQGNGCQKGHKTS